MKILLINPPFERLKGIAHIYFPLGLGYLCAAVSKNAGFDVMIYNIEVPAASEKLPFHVDYEDMFRLHETYIESLGNPDHYVWKEAETLIKEFKPDLIGITVMTAKYGSAQKISEMAKNIDKNCKIVWGGPHPTVDADGVLQNPFVDFIVRGEGEIVFKELVESIYSKTGNFSDIRGLSYKTNGKTFHNPDAELIENLDEINQVERNRVFFRDRYMPSSWGDMVTLRGCPFKCGYCGAHNTWSYRVRYRSPLAIIREMKDIISRYDMKQFYFWDDNFTLNRQRVSELCGLIREMDIPVRWGCTTRVDLLDDLIIQEMKRAGCDHMSIGIETGSERMLENIQKGITLEKVYAAVDLLDKHSMEYEAFFMAGFPEEREDDIRDTMDCIKQLKNARVCLSVFTPYPGTRQYEIAKELGLVSHFPEWSSFSHQSRKNHFMKYVSKERFSEIMKEIIILTDRANSKNVGIIRLFWNSCLDLRLLIRHPRLFMNKLKTFKAIITQKVKNAFS